MSYIRFKRLRKFVNGTATDEYMKSTERYDLIAYDSYFSCTQGYAEMTRWVDTPIVECHNNNLCSMQKQQVSYDGGISWSDTGIIQVKDIIEYESRECLSYLEEWRVVQGEYTCENFNKYAIEAEYVSYDSGETWEATGQTRIGSLVEPLSSYCGVLYQWVTVPNEFICVGTDKYTLQKEQYSLDEGTTWIDTLNERPGTLIETESEDCGYEPSYIYQWVVVSGEYVCVGTDKFQKEKEQRSADGGQTWTDTGNTRAGSLIERQSYDCGYISYRWVTDPTTYECVNYDKYAVEKEQQTTDGETWTDTGRTRTGSLIEHDSYDCGYISYRWVVVSGEYVCVGYDKHEKEKEQQSTDGETWTDTGRTRAGQLIEQDSSYCGYIPPVPPGTKVIVYFKNGDIWYTPSDGTDYLCYHDVYSSDTSSQYYNQRVVKAIVADYIKRLYYESSTGTFSGCRNMTEVVLPSSLTSIGTQAFYNCESIETINLPSTVTFIGSSAFQGCINLRSITIPESTTTIASDAFHNCYFADSSFINNSSATGYPWDATIYQNAFETQDGMIISNDGTILYKARKNVTSVNIPNTVTTIRGSAFDSRTGLTTVTIPDSVTSIGSYAFYECNGLTSVSIGNSVTSIGTYAFQGCRNISNDIVIPSTITSIGTRAFAYCSSITSITCLATTPPTLGTYSLATNNSCPIYVPAESVETYKSATNWSSYKSRIKAIS